MNRIHTPTKNATKGVPELMANILRSHISNRCYVCGWPFASCKPFDCGMRYSDDTQHLADKEKWQERATEQEAIRALLNGELEFGDGGTYPEWTEEDKQRLNAALAKCFGWKGPS